MKYISSLRRFGWLLISYLLLLVILLATDPFHSPLWVVVVPFVLLFVAVFLTGKALWSAWPGQPRITPRKRLIITAGVAWLPVILLILRSIDQLTVRDGLILAVFIAALLLYISRTNFSRS